MSAIVRSAKKVTRLATGSARSRKRFAQSFRVFLLGIVIACGIEVAVDWHSTLGEVRALRERVRARGLNYAAVLVRPLAQPLANGATGEVQRLVDGLFDDLDVVFVRVVGADRAPIFERIEPEYAAAFAAERGASFASYYAHQLERDAKGILEDPEGLRSRMEQSRHHDFAQGYQDLLISLHLAKPERVPARREEIILFQDRLYTTNKAEHDSAVTYSLGRIEGADAKPLGALVIGFDMRATNAAIRGKYLKGIGLVAFFVLLILVQNVTSRRERLRVLEIESKYARAKESIRAALPASLETPCLRMAGAIEQCVGTVDGMLWDAVRLEDGVEIVIVDPAGDGLEAGAVALHVRATYGHRREEGGLPDLRAEIAALGAAALRIPGRRPIGVVLLRVSDRGAVVGLRCGMGALRVIDGDTVSAIDERPSPDDPPEGVVAPVVAFSGQISAGGLLLVPTDGYGEATKRLDPDAIAEFVARSRKSAADLGSLAADAATWARGKSADVLQKDIIVVVAERRG